VSEMPWPISHLYAHTYTYMSSWGLSSQLFLHITSVRCEGRTDYSLLLQWSFSTNHREALPFLEMRLFWFATNHFFWIVLYGQCSVCDIPLTGVGTV
jgi:hypothetical protein